MAITDGNQTKADTITQLVKCAVTVGIKVMIIKYRQREKKEREREREWGRVKVEGE